MLTFVWVGLFANLLTYSRWAVAVMDHMSQFAVPFTMLRTVYRVVLAHLQRQRAKAESSLAGGLATP